MSHSHPNFDRFLLNTNQRIVLSEKWSTGTCFETKFLHTAIMALSSISCFGDISRLKWLYMFFFFFFLKYWCTFFSHNKSFFLPSMAFSWDWDFCVCIIRQTDICTYLRCVYWMEKRTEIDWSIQFWETPKENENSNACTWFVGNKLLRLRHKSVFFLAHTAL